MNQKSALRYGIICSVLYVALFFPSFYIGVLVPHLLENANIQTASGLTIVFLSILAPISLVVGTGMIWFKYFAENFKGVYFACLFPIISCLIILLLMLLIRVVLL